MLFRSPKKLCAKLLLAVALAASCSTWCFGQTQGRAEVTSVSVESQADGVKAIVHADGPLAKPRVERLRNPERLAFDLVDATPKMGHQRIAVNHPLVRAVRTSLFGEDSTGRPITRIVFDLNERSDFETESTGDGLAIRISGKVANPPTPVAQSRPRPPAMPVRESHGAAETLAPTNLLKGITTTEGPAGTAVVLNFSQPAQASMQALQNPKRFVLDFAGARFAPGWTRPAKTASTSLRGVRSSIFKEDPPVLRVVFDENESAPQAKVSVEGTTVRVQYPERTITASTESAKTAPLPPVATNSNPPEQTAVPKSTPQTVSNAAAPIPGSNPNKPRVTYRNGLLSVDANNSILADVMYAIGEQTGADVNLPFSDAMMDRVDLKMGPVTARQLLATLLEGSGYTYFIVEDGSGHLQKVILTPKEAASSK